MISRFVDAALSPEATADLEKHLETCPECRQRVKGYQTLAGDVIHLIHQQTSRILSTGPEHALLRKISAEKEGYFPLPSPFRRLMDFVQGKKFYLQMASFAAILLLGTVFLQDQETIIRPPSAIVNSIDGDMASVMILETRGKHHTIIWYKET